MYIYIYIKRDLVVHSSMSARFAVSVDMCGTLRMKSSHGSRSVSSSPSWGPAAFDCRPSWLVSVLLPSSRWVSSLGLLALPVAVLLCLVRFPVVFTMSRSIRRWARRNVWSLSLVSVRKVQPYKSAGGRRYRAAEQTWSAVERVPIACEFVAKLVTAAPC